MKKNFPGNILKAVVISSASLAAGTMTVHAQEMTPAQEAAPEHATPINATPIYVSEHGFYVDAELGINFASNLSNSGVLFNVFGNAQVALNPGVSAFLSTGYSFRFTPHFSMATELQIGVMYNTFGNGTGVDSSGNPVNTSGGGNVLQAPLLVNLVWNYKFNTRWSVYWGLGIGEMYNNVSVSNSQLELLEAEYGNLTFDLEGGVKCKLGPGDLGLGYKYIQNIGNFWVDNPISNNILEASYTIHF